jgi:hypothetical protein
MVIVSYLGGQKRKSCSVLQDPLLRVTVYVVRNLIGSKE